MVRKRKAAAPRKLKRNPIARSLRSPLFRERQIDPPDRPRRQPRHRKPLETDAEADD
jgi:hypothetical protein